jgi:hypothetical protein
MVRGYVQFWSFSSDVRAEELSLWPTPGVTTICHLFVSESFTLSPGIVTVASKVFEPGMTPGTETEHDLFILETAVGKLMRGICGSCDG